MQKNHSLTWRAPAVALVAAIAYVLLTAAGAGAQVAIHETDISIENNGSGDANTGRNALVANDSINESISEQTEPEEEDGVIFQTGEDVNESEGEASLETGNATAVGNIAKNAVIQATAVGSAADALIAAAVGTPYGPAPISPLVASDEAPSPTTAEESTESEEDAESDIETEDEGDAPEPGEPASEAALAEGTSASGGQQTPVTSLPSSGSAAADAGTPDVPALATPPLDNTVMGAVSGAGPPGITDTDQTVDVDNNGDATANTGENTVVDGDVLTGNATATGNISETMTSQLIAALGQLNLVDQDVTVDNDGTAEATTGINTVEGGDLETGDADAAGSISANAAFQLTLAAGDQNLIDQAIELNNEGDATADTGENEVEDGEVATGDATATGNWAGSALGQRVITAGSEENTDIDQAIEGENVGDAHADTGENLALAGDDGEVIILTGNALAIGNRSALAASQDA